VSVGYVSPEAQVGGPLAMVQSGDQISIDLERREVNLEISPEEMRERMTKWTPPVPRVTSGYLVLYAQLASSASRGVILEGQE
jgi:dihydroxy-acid dehydratase